MANYIAYYENQVGGGAVERYIRFGRIYVGAPYQRGHGIGAFLGGLFRRIMPFLGSAARAVGKEAIHAGMNVVSDVASRRVPFREALEKRLIESGMNLKRKASEKIDHLMTGSGYKRRRKRRRVQKRAKRRGVKTSRIRKKRKATPKKKKRAPKKKKYRSIEDIFSKTD
uniref:Uncharacterized protein n=1 Tax=Bracon brevicornis TaxID=1563983 RepID=A0A6V7KHW5_9HYME